ncbi:MAG: ParB/RepB/Spo0J family partition protein [Saprospiraceae bacterium]|nr:ParB/RepB/Spo0J family partition protein [Saprospiraceae bacterium]MBK7811857.1 ParB/RepB/Spo0J family partition protein [Saprospiraceae bacterium]MBK9631861.1 ParB/RepB/Spo0J family partition protein [Saprospiraceae bacterium]
MSQKQELGKGLKALIANINKDDSKSTPVSIRPAAESYMVDISTIKPNPQQPRNTFEEDSIQELANSIKTFGIIQPLTVRKSADGGFQIISGERRYRASLLAGLTEVPAYIRLANDQEVLEMALVENIQREDLTPIEIAISYTRLMEECNLTQDKLADRVGKQRSTISNYVRLLKLPPEIQSSVKDRRISMGHARVIAGIEDLLIQTQLYRDILSKELSVREAEKLAQHIQSRKKISVKPITSSQDNMIKPIEDRLSAKIGTKVQIVRNQQGLGQIIIKFNSDQALNDILDRLED